MSEVQANVGEGSGHRQRTDCSGLITAEAVVWLPGLVGIEVVG